MKTLNNDTLKQFGVGILEKTAAACTRLFVGKYQDISTNNLVLVCNTSDYPKCGDIIVIINTNNSNQYWENTNVCALDAELQFSVFTYLERGDLSGDTNYPVYLLVQDRFGNIGKIGYNPDKAEISFKSLVKRVTPTTYNISSISNDDDAIEKILNLDILNYIEGDKFRIRDSDSDNAFFYNGTIEVIENTVPDGLFSGTLVLCRTFANNEKCYYKIIYRQKAQKWIIEYNPEIFFNTNVHLIGDYKDPTFNIFGIRLPISHVIINGTILTNYVPKTSDTLIDAQSINTVNGIMFNVFYIDVHNNKDFSMLLQAPDGTCRHASMTEGVITLL